MNFPMLGGIMGKTISERTAEGVFIFKGEINIAADFPTSVEVKSGWAYRIGTNVTDNDPTKTNTGQSFTVEETIAWNGTDWTDITGIEVWIDDGTDVQTLNGSRNVELQTSGLKDSNVTTPLKIGDSGNTSSNSENKTILGSINTNLTNCASAGLLTGGEITDGGGATIDIAIGTGYFKTTDAHSGTIVELPWVSSVGNVIPSDTVRYIGIVYSGGTASINIKTLDSWNIHTEWRLGSVVNEGGTLYILNNPWMSVNGVGHTNERFYETVPFQRADRLGGLILGETGSRNFTLTAGELYDITNEFTITAKDTSVSGTFDSYLGATLSSAGNTQWDNINYNNSGVLTGLGVGKWANLWWYVEASDHIVMVYGTQQHNNQASAEAEGVPLSIPVRITAQGRILGRFVFQNGAGTAALISSVFEDTFSSTGIADHLTLSNLTTGDAGHTQFPLLAGRSGGQQLVGGSGASEKLVLESTSHATKGTIEVKDPLDIPNAIGGDLLNIGVDNESPTT